MTGVRVYEPVEAVESGRKKPPLSEFKALTSQHKAMIDLMVYGLDEGGDIDGDTIPAGQPLTLVQAASAMGVRRKQAREIAQTEVFLAELNRRVKARALSERTRNLHRAIEIRDKEGLGLAADRTVQLKAIAQIERLNDEAKAQPAVSVTVNNGCDQRQVRAGYVIKLGSGPAGVGEPAQPSRPALELTADDGDD